MKDRKTTYFLYAPYECSAVEEYLEMMAERGWLLESISKPFFKFKRIEPKKLKFTVDILDKLSVFDPKDSKIALDYREYCEAAGWNYISKVDKAQIFYTEDYSKTIDIHTDEREKFKMVFKASLLEMASQIFLTLAIFMNLYIQIFIGSSDFLLTSNLMLVSVSIMGTFVVINSMKIINFFIWVIRARKKLKENKFMHYNNYKQLRRKNIFIKLYSLLTLTIMGGLLVFDGTAVGKQNITMIVGIIVIIVTAIIIKNFFNRKNYSKDTNIALTIGGTFLYVVVFMSFMGFFIFSNMLKIDDDKNLYSNIKFSITDIGYEKEDKKNISTDYSSSVIA